VHEHTYRFYIRQGEFELDVEGDQNFVEAYVAAFLAGEAEIEEHLQKRIEKKPGQTVKARKIVPASKGINKEALMNYVKGKNFSSDGKRYLGLMAFLKAQGAAEANAGDIRQCYKILGISFKATSRQNLFLMKKYGKVVSGSKPGMYALTPKGEKAAAKLGKRASARKSAIRTARRKKK
jgi:hypothetical protein